jgi:hypothetical protein
VAVKLVPAAPVKNRKREKPPEVVVQVQVAPKSQAVVAEVVVLVPVAPKSPAVVAEASN